MLSFLKTEQEATAFNGRQTNARTDTNPVHNGLINDFLSKELQHRKTPFSQSNLHNGCQPGSFCFQKLIMVLFEVYF